MGLLSGKRLVRLKGQENLVLEDNVVSLLTRRLPLPGFVLILVNFIIVHLS